MEKIRKRKAVLAITAVASVILLFGTIASPVVAQSNIFALGCHLYPDQPPCNTDWLLKYIVEAGLIWLTAPELVAALAAVGITISLGLAGLALGA